MPFSQLIWILLPALLLGFPLVLFVSHRLLLGVEKRRLRPVGSFVEVDGRRMNLFRLGPLPEAGLPTLVLLSGSGITAPVFEYRELCSLLAERRPVVILEKFGYGYADSSRRPRDLRTLVAEDREALRKGGIQPPYVLLPHSMSALEAILWAGEHPEEIAAIVGLDMAVPERYRQYSHRLRQLKFFHVMTTLGYQRIPGIFPVDERGLRPDEARQNRWLAWRNALDGDVFRESLSVVANAALAETWGTPDVPFLMFTTDLNKKPGYESWMECQKRFAQKGKRVRQVFLSCGHDLHRAFPERLKTEVDAFLDGLSLPS